MEADFSKWKKKLVSLQAGTWAKFSSCFRNLVIKWKMILLYDMQSNDFGFFHAALDTFGKDF